ncbi:hypothetical protein TcCL_ESM10549 [Trypanosoma cruzi]|nr:hypothetical protein TcCL_ESM10549 [Trypanosoma cruzi]
MAIWFCRCGNSIICRLEKNDVRLGQLPSHSKRNLFYGREACNVELPNSDAAIHLGARVLVDVTATGDINGVTAAKRPCSFVRQSAGRPLHLPTPGMAWNLLEGWSRLGLRRARSNAAQRSSYMQPEPGNASRCDFIAGAHRILSRASFQVFLLVSFLLLLLVFYWNNNYLCAFPMAV